MNGCSTCKASLLAITYLFKQIVDRSWSLNERAMLRMAADKAMLS